MERNKVILGNWKMNMSPTEASKYIKKLTKLTKWNSKDIHEFAIIPPLHLINDVNRKFYSGAQTVSEYENGAHTGRISAKMLFELRVKYCLVGHSEMRQEENILDKLVNTKIKALLNYDITPVVCIGENLDENQKSQTKLVIKKQLTKGLKDIDSFKSIIIAYEPIWAIGTGKVPSLEYIVEVTEYIKEILSQMYNEEIVKKVKILYGGSVNDSNSKSILEINSLDGLLVGGASMDPENFYRIISK